MKDEEDEEDDNDVQYELQYVPGMIIIQYDITMT
jgi:hypothetical protein